MKNNQKIIKSIFTILLFAILLLSGCSPIVDNSGAGYIEVEKALNWKKIYQIGETISLDGLTVKYFPDIESTDFEIITLTEDMITDFDTSKEGNFTMTITYKGKTDLIEYTVVPKATPFELVESFCIGENTIASIDSTLMKVRILVFDDYFKACENDPAKIEEKNLSYHVNNQGKTCISFEYNGSGFDIFRGQENDQYHMVTSSFSDNSSSSVVEQLIHPISTDELPLPQKNVIYESEIKENIYYTILIDDSYNAVVTKHEVKEGTTVDTVMDSYVAADAVLTSNGLLRYSQSKDGTSATATMGDQGQFKIRKDADGNSEPLYSILCSLKTKSIE